MKLKMKALVPLLVFLALCGVLWMRLTSGESTRILPSELINHEFPAFELQDLYDEDTIMDESLMQGEVRLVNVFGSWCVACVAEHDFLRELKQSGEITIIGIDWRDDRKAAQDWLARGGNPYAQIIFDPESTLAIDLGVTGAPESFIVDKNGRIRYKFTGPLYQEAWVKTLRPVIAQIKAEK